MRTNIVIDDELLAEAQRLKGHRTKKATVEAALRALIALEGQVDALKALRGQFQWEGNLNESRLGRDFDLDRRR
jgi:Arc/MetJ family transcription regulator